MLRQGEAAPCDAQGGRKDGRLPQASERQLYSLQGATPIICASSTTPCAGCWVSMPDACLYVHTPQAGGDTESVRSYNSDEPDASNLVTRGPKTPLLTGSLLKRFLKQSWAAAKWALRAELEERPTTAMQAAVLFHDAESKVRQKRAQGAHASTASTHLWVVWEPDQRCKRGRCNRDGSVQCRAELRDGDTGDAAATVNRGKQATESS